MILFVNVCSDLMAPMPRASETKPKEGPASTTTITATRNITRIISLVRPASPALVGDNGDVRELR